MASGKRLKVTDPLTEHDIAARLDKAGLRVLQILMDTRQIPGLMEAVKHSRYLTNVLNALAYELQVWGFTAIPLQGHPGPEVDSTSDRGEAP